MTVCSKPSTEEKSGSPDEIRRTALRRISSFTDTDFQPDSFSWPRVAGREDMRRTLSPIVRTRSPGNRRDAVGQYHPDGMDLSGTWRAALADDDLRRAAFALDFDDDDWEPIEVPGH